MDYLAHYGILKQKWGVRRFQNEDGTLTEAGKKRYAKNATKAEKLQVQAKEYRARALAANNKAYSYSVKRDRVKSKIIQTDLSIGRANKLDQKRARQYGKSLRYESKAARLESRAAKFIKKNNELISSAELDVDTKKLVTEFIKQYDSGSARYLKK